jgi:hypothetical protein
MAKPFLHILHKANGDYASIYTPSWVNGKKENNPVHLGRVIDLEKGIFQSRARGIFTFDFENGYKTIQPPKKYTLAQEERAIIFGNVYIAYEILKRENLLDIFYSICPKYSDSLLSLILFRLLTEQPYVNADSWCSSTYCKILFPNSTLQSQRISEILSFLGSEINLQTFFQNYLKLIYPNKV